MIWSAHPTNALSDGRPLVQYDYLVLCLRLRALSKRGVHAVTVPVFEVARTLKCFIYFLRSHFFTRGSFASLLSHVGAYSHLPTSLFTIAEKLLRSSSDTFVQYNIDVLACLQLCVNCQCFFVQILLQQFLDTRTSSWHEKHKK